MNKFFSHITTGTRAVELLPYFSIIYFIEILYFMFVISFLMGKVPGLIFGTLLLAFLLWHTVGLYSMKNRHREIQLLLMDIHVAFSAAFVFNRLVVSSAFSTIDEVILVVRALSVAAELPMILLITGRSSDSYK